MARFKRDEQRTYPLTWLIAGGLFAFSAAWACYAEFVTRVPWQKEQQAFFDMEYEQAKQGKKRTEVEFAATAKPEVDKLDARKKQLDADRASGKYATAKAKLDWLNAQYSDAEQGKTFGKSDLDEAYYYRELAEYDRDAAEERARQALEKDDLAKGHDTADKLLADPPPKAKPNGVTADMHHLHEEMDRNKKRAEQIDAGLASLSEKVHSSWEEARDAELKVVAQVTREITHQERVDKAVAAMVAIDGPADPAPSEKDLAVQAKLRAQACAAPDARETRKCTQWLDLDPIDNELAGIDRTTAKLTRPTVDAQLRLDKADDRAHPKFDPKNLINSLVGPLQIQQVVTRWQDADADVDKEAVDRCMTCHMGSDSGNYTDAKLPRHFRSHPFRKTLFTAHPVEKFGCTSCHQGQGRATDRLAHSRTTFREESPTGPRWVLEGDEFWEDLLLPIGALHHIVIDDDNDSFGIKIGAADWQTVEIPHRSPELVLEKEKSARDASGKGLSRKTRAKTLDYPSETSFFGTLQELAAKALGDDDAKSWHVVVRKTDGRAQIGLEQNNPLEVINEKARPKVKLKFPKRGLAELLGFNGITDLDDGSQLYTAPKAPTVPVRAESGPHWDAKTGRYTPPTARQGLQLAPDFRDRFIQGLPEIEGGCLRCHGADVDLRPRESKAKYILSKLDRQKAEDDKKADPAAYKQAHGDDLPEVLPDPANEIDPVPALTEGRYLFKKLNCTGCHILDGFAGNRNAGPQLNDISAKVTPEWLLKWVRYPRAWRHKTRMPNFWPAPLDPASKLPYPAASPEYVKWEAGRKNESLAIASYLMEGSERPETRPGAKGNEKPLATEIHGYGDVDAASADKGKQYFDAYGCRGCHVTSEENLPAQFRERERDVAPSLANVGSKMNADWLTYWIENPSRYWHGTRMPNLRLSHVEAASVAKYLLTLKDEPKDTAPVSSDDVSVLSSPAKRHEMVSCEVAGPGSQLPRDKCGEKLIAYYGCFGCHNIQGFENYAPIAPELTGWSRKDVSKLDYGYAIDDHNLQTHETFLAWKLDSPRIYRRDRIELRMADFDLSPAEIRALSVFVMGLAEAKPLAEFNPAEKPDYEAAVEGRQIVDDYNCRGCHRIEDHGGDIAAAVKVEHLQMNPPYLTGEGMRVQPEWLFSFLQDPAKSGIRPFLHPEWAYGDGKVPADKLAVRMPTFPFTSEQMTAVVRYFASWEKQEYPYQQPHVRMPSHDEKLYVATHMNSVADANCISCHFVGDFPVPRGLADIGKMAPNLGNVSRRLRPEWVEAWVSAPMNWLPYTKMLTLWNDPFGPANKWEKIPADKLDFPLPQKADDQIRIVRDFLFSLQPDSVWPKPGEEGKSQVVQSSGSGDATAAVDKDGKPIKGKVPPPKKHGDLGAPPRG